MTILESRFHQQLCCSHDLSFQFHTWLAGIEVPYIHGNGVIGIGFSNARDRNWHDDACG